MRIAILHDAVPADAPADSLDTLVQAEAVAGALARLGHTVDRLSCGLNLERLEEQLRAQGIELVFNLVESLNGRGSLIHLPPFCLEAMDLPFTGCGAEAMVLTSNKVLAKERLAASGIAVPAWIGPWPGSPAEPPSAAAGDWIIKSVWEHGSIGLDAASLVRGGTPQEVFRLLPGRARMLGGSCFAEHFIAGREFNLALLAGGAQGPDLLPPAEMLFLGGEGSRPVIVDYAAKWDASSPASQQTRRTFAAHPDDSGLRRQMEKIALDCWRIFALRGYARVDFRVDAKNRPWVLEVNANPCLAPDAGFASALEVADISFDAAIARIVDDCRVASAAH